MLNPKIEILTEMMHTQNVQWRLLELEIMFPLEGSTY